MYRSTVYFMKELLELLKTELQQKGFSTITVDESDFDNTIKVTIIGRKHNPYGATMPQVKFLERTKNIGHWNDDGASIWNYSHSKLLGCSKSAISWLLDCAKNNPNIDFDLLID